MWERSPKVVQKVGVSPASGFEGVGQDGEQSLVERALRLLPCFVDVLGESHDVGREQVRVEGDRRAEWVPEEAAQHLTVKRLFCLHRGGIVPGTLPSEDVTGQLVLGGVRGT